MSFSGLQHIRCKMSICQDDDDDEETSYEYPDRLEKEEDKEEEKHI